MLTTTSPMLPTQTTLTLSRMFLWIESLRTRRLSRQQVDSSPLALASRHSPLLLRSKVVISLRFRYVLGVCSYLIGSYVSSHPSPFRSFNMQLMLHVAVGLHAVRGRGCQPVKRLHLLS